MSFERFIPHISRWLIFVCGFVITVMLLDVLIFSMFLNKYPSLSFLFSLSIVCTICFCAKKLSFPEFGIDKIGNRLIIAAWPIYILIVISAAEYASQKGPLVSLISVLSVFIASLIYMHIFFYYLRNYFTIRHIKATDYASVFLNAVSLVAIVDPAALLISERRASVISQINRKEADLAYDVQRYFQHLEFQQIDPWYNKYCKKNITGNSEKDSQEALAMPTAKDCDSVEKIKSQINEGKSSQDIIESGARYEKIKDLNLQHDMERGRSLLFSIQVESQKEIQKLTDIHNNLMSNSKFHVPIKVKSFLSFIIAFSLSLRIVKTTAEIREWHVKKPNTRS